MASSLSQRAVAVALLLSSAHVVAATCDTFRTDVANLQSTRRLTADARVASGMDVVRQVSQNFNNVCMANLSALNVQQFAPAGSPLLARASTKLCQMAMNKIQTAATKAVGTVMDQAGKWTNGLGKALTTVDNFVDKYGNVINGASGAVISLASGDGLIDVASGTVNPAVLQAIGNNSGAIGTAIGGPGQGGSQVGQVLGEIANTPQPTRVPSVPVTTPVVPRPIAPTNPIDQIRCALGGCN